jgi:outer membrane protein assembly factor BamB
MLVLAGMVVTLLLAAILGDGYPIGAVGATSVSGRVPAGAVMSGGGGERARSGGSHWQRALDAGPVTHLHASADAAVAAAGDTVFTLEPDDGEVRWRSRTPVGEPAAVVVSGQTVGVWSARLRALRLRDGTPRWEHVDVLTPLAAVTASDRVVYGIRQRWTGSELVALDSGSGRPLWRFDGGAVGMSDEAVVGVGNHTVAVLQDGHLFAIDPGRQASGATGMRAARWHREVARPWRTPLVLSDVVIVATRGGRVCAYAAADGAEQWCAQVAGVRHREPAVVASGGVVAVITPSQVTGLARGSGTQQWVHEAPHALAPIATASGDDVVVTDDTGTLRGLEAGRGRERWRVSGVGRITALTAGDGAIYAGTRNGRVVRVRLERSRHDHGHSPVVEAQRDRQS